MLATFSVLVRVAGSDVTGLWILLNSLLGFARVADFWSKGLSSFVGEARGQNDPAGAAKFVSTAVISGAAGYLLIVLVALPVLYLLSDQLAGPERGEVVRHLLPLMGCSFWLLATGSVYQLGFLGFGQPFLKAVQTVGGAVIFLIGAILLAPSKGIEGILLAQVLQGAIMLLFAAIVFHAGVGRQQSGGWWQFDRFRKLAVFGSKVVVVGSVQMAIEPVTKLLANMFGGLAAVTLVELASRLVSVVRGTLISTGQILVPGFARQGVAADGAAKSSLYKDACKLTLLLSVPAFCVMLSAAPLAGWLFLGEVDQKFIAVLWILSAGAFASAAASPAYFLLVARRHMRPLLWANVLMTGTAITLGTGAGLLGGFVAAMAGIAAGYMLSSAYTIAAAGRAHKEVEGFWKHELPSLNVILPLVVTSCMTILLLATGYETADAAMKAVLGLAVISVSGLTCFHFGKMRVIPQLVGRIRA